MFCPPFQAERTTHNWFKTKVHTPIFLAALAVVVCFAPLHAGEPAAKMPVCDNPVPLSSSKSFFIGHSLVNFDMPLMLERLVADAGLNAEVGTQVNNGAPIRFNWSNRFRASFPGEWPPPNFAGDDLPSGDWDALIMTEGIPLQTNVTWNESSRYAGNFVDLARQHNSATRSYIYETWHSLDEANWLQRIVDDLPLWESIMEDVNATRDNDAMYLIPAGQALRNLILMMEGGQIPGYTNRTQLFVDDIHMNDQGNYLIACVMYAALYRRSPVGLDHTLIDRWGQPYSAPSAAMAAAMQQVAWDTVRNYEHNGWVCSGGGNQRPNGTIDSPASNRTITAGESVSFAGSASDPDNNTPFSYVWNFDGGAANSTQQDPGSVRFDTPGSYDVTFTVTDSLGLADNTPDTVRITVQAPANQAPDGSISRPSGNRTITAGDQVTFTASASDPDGNTPLSYLWNFDGGAANSTNRDPGSVRFNTPGTYDVTFTVTDSLGLADPTPDTVRITVQAPANQAPNGIIDTPTANRTITAGDTVSFTASASDPDNHTPFTYFWNFDGGAANSTAQDPGSVRFNTPGTFDVTFTVTDNLGLADPAPDTVRITVQAPANQAPNGTIDSPASNVTITEGESVFFAGSASDPDNNTPFSYVWHFGGGASNSSAQDPGNVRFSTPGTYTVTFTVTDSLGLADPTPASVRVTVEEAANQAPNGTIDTPTGNVTITEGQTVSFSGSASDPDGDTPLTYAWNFGGGASNSSAQDPGAVRFNNPGTYTVTFTVTDSQGLSDPTPASVRVTVEAENRAPNGRIDSPASGAVIQVGGTVTFAGSASDPDGDTNFRYLWNFDGAAADSSAQNPGQIRFDQEGSYTITLRVWDSENLEDPSPAQTTIQVTQGNRAPNGTIDSPAGNLTIQPGQQVFFAGSASDPDGDSMTYHWNYSGGVSDSTRQDPGSRMFTRPGRYVVTFTVTDEHGVSDPSPAQVVITVEENGGNGSIPTIASPAKSMSVVAGGSVMFSGLVGDLPSPLSYQWNFGGGAPGSNVLNPGLVTFNTPGMYEVTLTVFSQSVSYTSRPLMIEVVTCEQPRIMYNTLIQGLAPVELEAVMCDSSAYTVTWQNRTRGGIIARDTGLLTLDPQLTETTTIRLNLFHTASGNNFNHDVTVLVPANAELADYDGNGCNDLADLRGYATNWRDRNSAMDANGDDVIDIRDLLHINTMEEGACP
ncbi:PKD domain-containing protein [Acanthopleuribacter pedis]|uniref:PKD domain-containing protein n=1 Tax=Acanthopleuribacter pedis TaxID=442870 RepID=A0A8J7U4Q7_9BACT|nr:PKD domain-containing protein [Acanthopleuribacter pedis]MBO1320897.1 PKD domain-containing protein [Acanthopleuribacter pedis]